MLTGQSNYVPQKRFENRRHIIGDVKAPILICKKKEIKDLFTPAFWFFYEAWKNFNVGMGLPELGGWAENRADVVSVVREFETYYRKNFSQNAVIIQYLEAILKKGTKR